VYEEDEGRKAKSERETFELTPADLAALPDVEYTKLQQAVNTADLRTMQRLIEQIREYNTPVADALTTLGLGQRVEKLARDRRVKQRRSHTNPYQNDKNPQKRHHWRNFAEEYPGKHCSRHRFY
jgi:hypothetical protein